uniref:Protein arginine N-methyltransferase 5 n=1 Tax=Romanomermis culicivorax TaxID=13658 RepID=A0A915KMM4_ROMCU
MYKATGYEDIPYLPAAPLTETLSYNTYSTYASDRRKYRRYLCALKSALANFVWKTAGEKSIVIMVLGAGRGPLVSASIEALSSCSVHGKVYAVEKNPNAIVTLNFLNRTKWDNQVTVVFSDMRDFHPSDENKADIVVSELLGSFGDNELSPECLDGALHLMKVLFAAIPFNPMCYRILADCISIPCNYTSYIAPIHSPKLHQTVRQQALREQQIMADPLAEPMYFHLVINVPSFNQVSSSHFVIVNNLSSNDRFKELTFFAKESCDLSGLVGFFNAELFTGSTLNILPNRHTPGLFSWFPIYFPFKDPIFVKKGEKIVIDFWRASNARQVWYEWCMVKPIQTPIMNCNGRSSAIRKI